MIWFWVVRLELEDSVMSMKDYGVGRLLQLSAQLIQPLFSQYKTNIAFWQITGGVYVDDSFPYGSELFQDWSIHLGLVSLVREANSEQLLSRGILVEDIVRGQHIENSDGRPNIGVLPFAFHYGAIMSWAKLQEELIRKEKLMLDTNISTDLFLIASEASKILHGVLVDGSSVRSDDLMSTNVPSSWSGREGETKITKEEYAVRLVIDLLHLYLYKNVPLFSDTMRRLEDAFLSGNLRTMANLVQALGVHAKEIEWNMVDYGEPERLRKLIEAHDGKHTAGG